MTHLAKAYPMTLFPGIIPVLGQAIDFFQNVQGDVSPAKPGDVAKNHWTFRERAKSSPYLLSKYPSGPEGAITVNDGNSLG
jgi:hypothetical protein